MKTRLNAIVCVALAAGLGLALVLLGRTMGIAGQQQTEIAALRNQVNNLTAATLLTSQEHWYFVKPGEVSSKPYGEGLRVKFDPGRDMYNTLPSRARFAREIERFKNRKVRFTRSADVNNYYVVAAGLLDFEYVDPEGVGRYDYPKWLIN